jgi:hypothetical protein
MNDFNKYCSEHMKQFVNRELGICGCNGYAKAICEEVYEAGRRSGMNCREINAEVVHDNIKSALKMFRLKFSELNKLTLIFDQDGIFFTTVQGSIRVKVKRQI